MNWQRTTSENTRFLYQISHQPMLDWQRRLEEVNRQKEEYPSWKFANRMAHFYFFSSYESEKWEELPYWVGRELVGFAPFDPPEDWGLIDLDQGDVFVVEGRLELTEISSFMTLFEKEEEFRHEIEAEEGVELAPTWKLGLEVDLQSGEGTSLGYRFTFFIQ